MFHPPGVHPALWRRGRGVKEIVFDQTLKDDVCGKRQLAGFDVFAEVGGVLGAT
jgi:hypothetical protein